MYNEKMSTFTIYIHSLLYFIAQFCSYRSSIDNMYVCPLVHIPHVTNLRSLCPSQYLIEWTFTLEKSQGGKTKDSVQYLT